MNDKIGLMMFTDEVELYIPPKKGRNHVLRVIREMLYFQPQRKGTNIQAALEYLNRVMKRKAVVFLVSDFLAFTCSDGDYCARFQDGMQCIYHLPCRCLVRFLWCSQIINIGV